MVVYVCNCLNVKIFADALKIQDVNQSSPLGANVVEIELGDRGFDFKYGFLLKRETIKTWTVFTCLNCKKKTHTINRELKLILVNKDMECGDEALARLTGSPDFSPVFQIILVNTDSFATPDPSAQSYDSLQHQLTDITHHLNNFILKQEDQVEERIRRFEEEQREQLAKLKAKAQDDKKRMISLLLQQTESQDQSGAGRGRPRTALTKANSVFTDSPRPPLSQPMAMPGSRRDNVVPDIDRDELFTIDGIDDEYGSYNSGSEEEDDVPNVVSRTRTSSRNANDSIYSASVPVNIGMGAHWEPLGRGDHLVDLSDSEDENKPLDPAQIASNMQALAESIPDEHRYIFGDRPRPRLNTNNF